MKEKSEVVKLPSVVVVAVVANLLLRKGTLKFSLVSYSYLNEISLTVNKMKTLTHHYKTV
jgi:hypothetical protein